MKPSIDLFFKKNHSSEKRASLKSDNNSCFSFLGKTVLTLVFYFVIFGANAATWFWKGGNGTSGSPLSFTSSSNWATAYGGSTTGSPTFTGASDIFIIDGGNLGSGATGTANIYVSGVVSLSKLQVTGGATVQLVIQNPNTSALFTGVSITTAALDLGTANASGSNVGGGTLNDGGYTINVLTTSGSNGTTITGNGTHNSATTISSNCSAGGSIQSGATTATTALANSGATSITIATGLTNIVAGELVVSSSSSIPAGTTVSSYTSGTGVLALSFPSGFTGLTGSLASGSSIQFAAAFTVGTGLNLVPGMLVTSNGQINSSVYLNSYNSSTGVVYLTTTFNSSSATIDATAVAANTTFYFSGEIKWTTNVLQTIPSGITFGNLDLNAATSLTYVAGGNFTVGGTLYFSRNASGTANTTIDDKGFTISVANGIWCWNSGAGMTSTAATPGKVTITGSTPLFGQPVQGGGSTWTQTVTLGSLDLNQGSNTAIISPFVNLLIKGTLSFNASSPNAKLQLNSSSTLTIGNGSAFDGINASVSMASTNSITTSASSVGNLVINSSGTVGTLYFDQTNTGNNQ